MSQDLNDTDDPEREPDDSPMSARPDETPEGVLSPTELGPPDEVTELAENRFVVAPDGESSPHVADEDTAAATESDDTDEASLPSGAYAAAVTMRTPEGTRATQVSTNDIRELFDELLVWYVEGMAPNADPDEALSVLVRESSLSLD
ncbi:hypothetical protein [Natronomonas gomsonensis]|uniref:DUF7500 family protein n=1 Tax=Natronomonas gomsonensis TaxID=1046043 RepID=UPI0015B8764D|nr:hypothetical protein [Natronomonas gomsonensis]